jgi:hypothetical protein
MIQMRKFEYRSTRHRTDIPILVRPASGCSLLGRCTDVSADGIGVKVADELPVGDTVTVEFTLEGCFIDAVARIEYCHNGNYYGMRFQFPTERERDALQHLIESIHKVK